MPDDIGSPLSLSVARAQLRLHTARHTRQMIKTGFSDAIADRIAAEHALLAARWFARLRDLLPVGANEVFPSDSLLEHIPSLIVDISIRPLIAPWMKAESTYALVTGHPDA